VSNVGCVDRQVNTEPDVELLSVVSWMWLISYGREDSHDTVGLIGGGSCNFKARAPRFVFVY